MGVFDRIKNAIWGKREESTEPEAKPASSVTPAGRPTLTQASTATPGGSVPSQSPMPPRSTVGASPAPAQSASPSDSSENSAVDVAAILDAAVKANGQKLDWRRSIVDLMKALDLDSSLSNRKELAQELDYTGDMNDSATMNVWLHKALMKKLAENGGRVPSDLAD